MPLATAVHDALHASWYVLASWQPRCPTRPYYRYGIPTKGQQSLQSVSWHGYPLARPPAARPWVQGPLEAFLGNREGAAMMEADHQLGAAMHSVVDTLDRAVSQVGAGLQAGRSR